MAVVIGNAVKDLGLDIRARQPFSRHFAGAPKQAFSAVYAFTLDAAEPILRSCLLLVGGVYHAAASAKPYGVPAVIDQFDLNSRTPS
jgi:hypothetical protein